MNRTRRRALLFILLAGVAAVAWWRHGHPTSPVASPRPVDAAETAARRFLELEARETEFDHTVWAPELEAERFEDALNRFWDDLHQSDHNWDVFAAFRPTELTLPTTAAAVPKDFFNPAADLPGKSFDAPGLVAWLTSCRDSGWQVRHSRWELRRHDVSSRRSSVHFEILAENSGTQTRSQFRGEASVVWTDGTNPRPLTVSVQRLEAFAHTGATDFVTEAELVLPVPPHTPFTDPLLAVTDAHSGATDLFLVGAALRFHREAGRWVGHPLTGLPTERLWAAAVADWDGNGHEDLVLAGGDGIRVLRGPDWVGPGEVVWVAPQRLKHPQTLSVGDYDGDGRPDIWLGQYKLPYQGGQFPTPYHDANDGFPSHLLHREGPSTLRDVTEEAGLGLHRHRRVYSGSFTDLRGDGHLDLVTASDFAGLDVYENDGHGHFRDRTSGLGNARHAFGMAHVTGDLDGDGRPDVFMAGMGSLVAGRLDALGLGRPDFPDPDRWRGPMTVGNRVFAGTSAGLVPAPWGTDLTDAGWAWAVTPLDLDNDGHVDFHLCNGHETRASVQDYERQFWRHDLYVGGSTNDPAVDVYFHNAAGRRAADRASYGGWYHGACFRHDRDGGYHEVGWLLGTAIPADTRNAVAADFDGDGRLDLAVTTYEEYPKRRQRLIILLNRQPVPNHWVGFRFDGCSGLNARMRITAGGMTQERCLRSGESYRSQAAGAVHFGLGTATTLEHAEIRWPDGTIQDLGKPAIDHWGAVRRTAR